MSIDEPDEIEGTEPAHRNEFAAAADEQTRKRARWEHMRLTACPGTGRVTVCNLSYGVHERADHTYTVTVERGQPTDCTCPAAEHQSGACKRVVTVAADRAVLDEAMHGGSDPLTDANANQVIATDGGGREPNMTCENDDCGRRYNHVNEGPACPECDAWGEQDPEPEGLEL